MLKILNNPVANFEYSVAFANEMINFIDLSYCDIYDSITYKLGSLMMEQYRLKIIL
jgi:hypothetical protein